jgi:hypothetical protein
MEVSSSGGYLWQLYRTYSDRLIMYFRARWGFTFLLLVLYIMRVSINGGNLHTGFHVVSYALAIFILNMLLRFLTPLKGDIEDEEFDKPVLPIRGNDEYKPFIRKLPEFKFWKNITFGCAVGFGCSFSKSLDIPVYWPILVVYFIILFLVTMRRQIGHMIKHNYVPWDIGKPSFKK